MKFVMQFSFFVSVNKPQSLAWKVAMSRLVLVAAIWIC